MGRACYLCGKKPHVGHNVSHANNKTKRRFMPNLQSTKLVINGQTRRVTLCTRCIRSGKFL